MILSGILLLAIVAPKLMLASHTMQQRTRVDGQNRTDYAVPDLSTRYESHHDAVGHRSGPVSKLDAPRHRRHGGGHLSELLLRERAAS